MRKMLRGVCAALLAACVAVLVSCRRNEAVPVDEQVTDRVAAVEATRTADTVSVAAVQKDTVTSARPRTYTQKELERIMGKMEKAWLKGSPADGIVQSFALFDGYIGVDLIYDSPRNRDIVRKYLCGEECIRFTGVARPKQWRRGGVADTLGVSIVPSQKAFSVNSKSISFSLVNNGKDTVMCGEEKYVAFLDKDGAWKELPRNTIVISIGYLVLPSKHHEQKVSLSPKAFPTPRGRFRLYYPVTIGRSKNVWLMADFNME